MKAVIRLFFLLIFTVFSVSLKAQINSTPDTPETLSKPTRSNNRNSNSNKFFKKENFVVGGGFGLGFGNLFTSFSISPEAGYHIFPDRIVVGGRFFYNYYRDKTVLINGDFPSLNIIGGGPFVRGYIWKGIMAQVEYEYTYIRRYPFLGGISGNQVLYRDLSFNGFLVGGGFHQNFESGPGFYFVVLFNVAQSTEWVYPNPVFRTGFTYTFKKQ